jgi:Ion channel
MLLALLVSTVLVLIVVLIHYEVLRFTSVLLPRLTIRPRQRILVVILAAFFAHAVEVWLYAIVYYFLVDDAGIGRFGGTFQNHFSDFLYFSTATYTTLGYGDIYPTGDLRLVAGIESIVGLMMIGWSVSFTYLAMEKFWGLHGPRRR